MRSERKQFFGSIRVRMVAIYLAVTIVALLAISFTVAILVESSLVNQRTKQQQEATTRLALEKAEQDGKALAESIEKELSDAADAQCETARGRLDSAVNYLMQKVQEIA